MDLAGVMSRAEFKVLSEEEKKERTRLQQRKRYEKNREKISKTYKERYETNKEIILERNRKYRENNRENEKERSKKHYQNNIQKYAEKNRKYRQTAAGKKIFTLGSWKYNGLRESQEDLDRIYELWLHQELCNACDVKLTRGGTPCSTTACMDHDHNTHRFRHIVCHTCNNKDSWMKYFC